MIKASGYLFDMDGLLLDTERVALKSFVKAVAPFDLDGAETFFLTLIGTSAAEGRQILRDYLPDHISETAVEDTWLQHYRQMLEQGTPVKPTVVETLERLTALNVPMAVVTSTEGDRARYKLNAAEILHHFDFVLGGDETSANKPDPAPYLEAAAKLGVPPTRCAAFEDSDRGITAAVNAGCIATQVPDLRPADQPFPQLGQNHATTLWEAVDNLHRRS